jgi:phytoene dehydrogenase-like protein
MEMEKIELSDNLPEKQPRVYTEGEAAAIMGIAEATLRKLRYSGRASYARIGRLVRYLPEHIEETMRLNTIRPRKKGREHDRTL